MTSGGGWGTSATGPYEDGLDDWSERSGGHSRAAGHGATGGYAETGGYGQDSYDQPGHGEPQGYDQPGYGEPQGYDQPGYGEQQGYDQPGYGEQQGYDQPGYGEPPGYGGAAGGSGYGERPGYGDPLGYGGAGGGYGEPPGYGERAGYGEPRGYGEPQGYGEPADGYGNPPGGYDSPAGYDAPAGYQAAPGYGPAGSYGPAGGYGDDPASYDEPTGSHRSGGYQGWGAGRYETADEYRGTDRYGAAAGYGGADGYDDPPSYPGSPYRQDPYAGAAPHGRAGYDTGDYDTGSVRRPDTGGFGTAESGTFRRADSGSFDRVPPPGAARAQWRDEPGGQGWNGREAEPDDWPDRADSGLLDRRFGADPAGRGARRGRSGPRVRAAGRRRRRFRGRMAVTLVVLVGAGLLGVGGQYVYHKVRAFITDRYGDYQGAGYGQVRVNVPRGASLTGLAGELLKDGVIMATRPYITAANAAQGQSRLQPGIYLLHHHMNAAIAVTWLLNPSHLVQDRVTIIEGTRASAIAKQLHAKTGYPVAAFMQLIDHPAKLGLPRWAGSTAEGFLFPDTYTLVPHETPLDILRQMVSEFRQQIAPVDTPAAAAKVGTTPWHVLIVASMVQAEAGGPTDFGKIARVAWNRLNKNMALQFDSTVFYALGTYGTAANAKQQHFASPYNTYLHTGLPPGPIGNPGLQAVEATLSAPHGPWLYFVTDTRHKPYITHFTTSYSQFLQWKKQFQG